jgi:hypothetical protein
MSQSLLGLFFGRTTRQESGAGPDSANAGFFRKKNVRRFAIAALAAMIFGFSACPTEETEDDSPPPIDPPILTGDNLSNLVSQTGTTATLSFKSDKTGKYYYLVLAADAAAPSADTVKAQGVAVAKGSGDITANTAKPISVSGLTAGVQYKAYIVVEADDVLSAVLSIVGVNPIANPYVAPNLTDGTVTNLDSQAGTTATLSFNSDAQGRYYYLTLAANAPAPTADTVRDQGTAVAKGSGDITTAGQVISINVTGLTAGVQYKAYIVVEANGVRSAVLIINGVNPKSLPILSDGGVSALESGPGTTATLSFKSNKAGTYYYLVLAADANAPDAATVKAQKRGTGAVTANTATPITVTGLTAGAQYKAYIIVEADGVLSAVLTINGVNPKSIPVLSDGGVSALGTPAGTTATLSFKSTKAGRYYYLVLAATATAPTPAMVKAQGTAVVKGQGDVTANTATPITVTGLTASAQYKAYIVVEANALLSAVLTINDVNPVVDISGTPHLSAGNVANLDTSNGTTATLNFTSDTAGTYYYVVLAANADAPTAATVKAQGTAPAKGTAAAVAGVNTISVTGLTAGAQYKAYIVVEANTLLSAVLTIDGVNPRAAPPALSEGMASALETTAGTTATLTFTSSKAGTYYYLVLAADASAPTADTVKAQGNAPAKGSGSVAAGANSISVTGLTVNTQYTAYIAAEAGGSLSAVLTIANVNPVQPDTAPPILSAFAESETTTPAGTSVKITFTSSEAATYRYTRALATAAAPSESTVQSSTSTGDAVAGENSFYLRNLTPDVANKLYIAAQDAAGNWSILYDYTVHPARTYSPSSWTEVSLRDTITDFNQINDIIYANGKYVAVGYTGSSISTDGRIGYSSTGTGGWQLATIPANNPRIGGVTYGGPAGSQKFVAVGRNRILTSTDGITWNADGVTLPSGLSTQLLDQVFWAGSQFVAYNLTVILTSPDGLTWTRIPAATLNVYFVQIKKILWDGTRLVALAADAATGDPKVFSSTDGGTSWNIAQTPNYEIVYKGLDYANGRYVLGGRLWGTSSIECTMAYSTDLITWTTITPDQVPFTECRDIEFSNGRFYLLSGQDGATRGLSWSTDGSSWTSPVPGPFNTGMESFKGLVYNDGKLFVRDLNGKIQYRTE